MPCRKQWDWRDLAWDGTILKRRSDDKSFRIIGHCPFVCLGDDKEKIEITDSNYQEFDLTGRYGKQERDWFKFVHQNPNDPIFLEHVFDWIQHNCEPEDIWESDDLVELVRPYTEDPDWEDWMQVDERR